MKLIIFLILQITILYASNINIFNEQSKIIKKNIYQEVTMNEEIYNRFWKGQPKGNMHELEYRMKEEFKLKLELWKSAKMSFLTLEVFYTEELKKFKRKKNKTDYEDKINQNFSNILYISALHRKYKLTKNNYIPSNQIFIENMISKQKGSLRAISALFSKSWNKKSFTELYKYGKIQTNFLFERQYVATNNGYKLILSGKIKDSKIYFKEIVNSKKNLSWCIKRTANEFLLKYKEKDLKVKNNSITYSGVIDGYNYNIKLICKKINNDFISLIEVNKKDNNFIIFDSIRKSL